MRIIGATFGVDLPPNRPADCESVSSAIQ